MVQTGLERLQWLLSVVAMVAFIAGYVLSIIFGVVDPDNGPVILILVILGVIVGILNITGKEIIPYLIAAIALIIVGNLDAFEPLNQVWGGLGDGINDIVGLMATFSAPAAVIQAIRAGVALARPSES
jgi:cell division protein FtsW (lipid II flippase)